MERGRCSSPCTASRWPYFLDRSWTVPGTFLQVIDPVYGEPVQRPPDTSKEDAAAAKEAGNAAMKLGTPEGLEEAVQHYTRAITLDGGNHVYWSNRSAAHVSLGKAKAAISDAEMCVELNPGWIKGYARLGTALFLDGDYATAVATYKAGLRCADRVSLSSSLRAPIAL